MNCRDMNCSDVVSLSPLYLSGELDESRAAGFVEHLETCAACASEIEQQLEMDTRLREGTLAEAVDSSAVDRRVRQQIALELGGSLAEVGVSPPPAGPVGSRWLVAAGIAAALLIALVGYRVFLGSKVARVYADAAKDHHSEVVEQQHRVWQSGPAAIEALAVRGGFSPSAIAALAPSGYRLDRGKLCRLDGRVFLHLVFTDGTREVSAFLRPRDVKPLPGDAEPLPGAVRETVNGRKLYAITVGSEHVALFQTDRLIAMVVAEQSEEPALHLARFAAGVL